VLGSANLNKRAKNALAIDFDVSPCTLCFFVDGNEQPIFVTHITQSINFAVCLHVCSIGHIFTVGFVGLEQRLPLTPLLLAQPAAFHSCLTLFLLLFSPQVPSREISSTSSYTPSSLPSYSLETVHDFGKRLLKRADA
jgi:hypothetical protein